MLLVPLGHVKSTTTKRLTCSTAPQIQERVNSDHLLSCTEWCKTSRACTVCSWKMQHMSQEGELAFSLFDFTSKSRRVGFISNLPLKCQESWGWSGRRGVTFPNWWRECAIKTASSFIMPRSPKPKEERKKLLNVIEHLLCAKHHAKYSSHTTSKASPTPRNTTPGQRRKEITVWQTSFRYFKR